MQYVITLNKIRDNFFWIPSSIMIVDAILKFLHISLWIDLPLLGLQDSIVLLGVIELCSLSLFLLPRTLTPGFFLVSCYWSGISFIGLTHQSFFVFPIVMQFLFIIVSFWKDNSNSFKMNSENLNQ